MEQVGQLQTGHSAPEPPGYQWNKWGSYRQDILPQTYWVSVEQVGQLQAGHLPQTYWVSMEQWNKWGSYRQDILPQTYWVSMEQVGQLQTGHSAPDLLGINGTSGAVTDRTFCPRPTGYQWNKWGSYRQDILPQTYWVSVEQVGQLQTGHSAPDLPGISGTSGAVTDRTFCPRLTGYQWNKWGSYRQDILPQTYWVSVEQVGQLQAGHSAPDLPGISGTSGAVTDRTFCPRLTGYQWNKWGSYRQDILPQTYRVSVEQVGQLQTGHSAPDLPGISGTSGAVTDRTFCPRLTGYQWNKWGSYRQAILPQTYRWNKWGSYRQDILPQRYRVSVEQVGQLQTGHSAPDLPGISGTSGAVTDRPFCPRLTGYQWNKWGSYRQAILPQRYRVSVEQVGQLQTGHSAPDLPGISGTSGAVTDRPFCPRLTGYQWNKWGSYRQNILPQTYRVTTPQADTLYQWNKWKTFQTQSGEIGGGLWAGRTVGGAGPTHPLPVSI
uniref:Uncharacterized protein n=1 Tax=Xenopus tropicalis TaxID=8364 RepID=A0A1B8Y170_XENTR